MPTGNDPNEDDDDTTTTGALKHWLQYKVGPVYGSVVVIAVFAAGVFAGLAIS